MEFTKDTTLAEVLEHDKGREILGKHEVPCLGCPMAQFEMEELTLEQICKAYGLNLDEILKELNEQD